MANDLKTKSCSGTVIELNIDDLNNYFVNVARNLIDSKFNRLTTLFSVLNPIYSNVGNELFSA